ncbi:phosphohistidine phosphatase SixA [Rheinheimera sp.]|uniref:phosphohistidine phosphatase SixA n=1 Tax=Rheinheimera sp. TaxID=1869214 RepID=UPI0027BB1CEF|nr:phosphohistidine phosphatase SixA [Rheinheimera sp.]
MVNLVIMRHGEAEPQSSQDSQRQLTAKGRDEVSQMALWLSQHYQAFDLVLCSPYVRTRQTAELMLKAQPATTRLEILPELVPEGDSHQVQLYLDALRAENAELRVLLVSHMPLVSFLVETFTKTGNTPIFETSGLVGIYYQPGEAGKLLERLAPADLALLSH